MRPVVCAILMLAQSACSSSTELLCHGTACTCPSDAFCTVASVMCGPTDCALECGVRSTCSGSCGAACAAHCETDASCDLGVGTGGSLSCGAGGDCHLTCGTSCTMSCAAGARCTIRCASDSVPRLITGSASCP